MVKGRLDHYGLIQISICIAKDPWMNKLKHGKIYLKDTNLTKDFIKKTQKYSYRSTLEVKMWPSHGNFHGILSLPLHYSSWQLPWHSLTSSPLQLSQLSFHFLWLWEHTVTFSVSWWFCWWSISPRRMSKNSIFVWLSPRCWQWCLPSK